MVNSALPTYIGPGSLKYSLEPLGIDIISSK